MKLYSIEFKEQILKEVREVGSVSLISRKHSVPTTTIHTWQKRLKTSDLNAKAKDDKDLKKKLAKYLYIDFGIILNHKMIYCYLIIKVKYRYKSKVIFTK